MQLSERTLKILKNFAGINSGIVIRKTPEGNSKTLIKTIDRQKTLFVQAEIDEVFENTVSFYDLPGVLAAISSFDGADVQFSNKNMTISSGKFKTNITYAEDGIVIQPDDSKDYRGVATDYEFELSKEDIGKLLNMASILTLPHLRIFAENGKILAQAVNADDVNSSTAEIELGESSETFDAYIKQENLKMLPGDYTVKIKDGVFASFTSKDDPDLFYCIALELI